MAEPTEPQLVYLDANPFIYFVEGDTQVSGATAPLFELLRTRPELAVTSEITLLKSLLHRGASKHYRFRPSPVLISTFSCGARRSGLSRSPETYSTTRQIFGGCRGLGLSTLPTLRPPFAAAVSFSSPATAISHLCRTE